MVGKLQYGAVGAGTVYGDRGGVIKVIGETQLRRAGRRAHRRRQGDRPDPGARQRQGARGRLLGGRAHRARPPHVLRGRHGGRPRRRWLAHPRLSQRRLLLRPRARPRPTSRRSASSACSATVPEFVPVRLAGLAAGGVGAFRCAEEEAIFRADMERARPPRPASCRCAGRPCCPPTRSGRCSSPPTPSRAAASWPTRWRRSGRRSRPGATSASATPCCSPPRPPRCTRPRCSRARSCAARARGSTRRPRPQPRPACSTCPPCVAGGRVFHGERELEAAAAALSAPAA